MINLQNVSVYMKLHHFQYRQQSKTIKRSTKISLTYVYHFSYNSNFNSIKFQDQVFQYVGGGGVVYGV